MHGYYRMGLLTTREYIEMCVQKGCFPKEIQFIAAIADGLGTPVALRVALEIAEDIDAMYIEKAQKKQEAHSEYYTRQRAGDAA